MSLTIGADPEFFVRKGNHWISGHIFECGTKREPMETDHGSVQVDGVALECNVRPAATRDEFVQNVQGVMDDLTHVARRVVHDVVLVPRPSVFFGIKRLGTLPPYVQELGCEPDFNAYTGRMNPRPDKNLPIRTGSGHVHLGFTEGKNPRDIAHFKRCCHIVRYLDVMLGLGSLSWDQDHRRRSLYGQAGAFRPKSYGLEYRVLSNAWCRDPHLIGAVFDFAEAAYAMAKDNLDVLDPAVPVIINTGNADEAWKYHDFVLEMVR